MIDIHTHILSGIDDGPQTLQESVDIAKAAVAAGVRTIVATPHIFGPPTPDSSQAILDKVVALRKQLDVENIDIEILSGAEFFIFPDLPKTVEEFKMLTINNNNRHVLVEVPSNEMPVFTEEIFFELLLGGITPILAHPERCRVLQKKTDILEKFFQNGVLFQINSGSLIGKYGRNAQKMSKQLLKKNMVHMIASDVHTSGSEYPLGKGIDAAIKIVGSKRVEKMISTTPEKIIRPY